MYDFDEIRKRFPSAQGLSENQIVERLAQRSGLPYEQVAAQFGITKDTSSGFFGGAQDVVIEAANAAAGLVGSASEFVSPGNRLSRGIRENIIEPGEARQTVPTQLAKRNLARGLETSELGPQARAVYDYVTENPLLALGQAAGGFAPVGLPIRGAQAAATGLGLGAAGARRAGLTTGSAISGAAAGGEAGGSAYELVMNTPREVLLAHPQARALIEAGVTDEAAIYEELATRAARRASVVPAAVGAVAGVVGAESALVSPVRGIRGVGRKVGGEFVTEAGEEGTTTYSGRAAAQEYNPAIDPMAGVAGSALLGGVMGAGVAAPIALARMERTTQEGTDLTQPDTAPAQGTPAAEAPAVAEAPTSPILSAARTLADFDPYAEIEARAAAGRPMSEAEATQFLSSTLAAQRAGQQFMDLMQQQQESAGRIGQVGEQYQRMVGQRGDQILRAQEAGESARPIVAGLEQDLTAQEAPVIAAQQAGAGTQQLPGMVAGAGTVADFRRIMDPNVMQPVETQEFQPVERTALLPQQPAPFSNIRMDRPGPAPTPAPSSLLSDRPAEPVTPVGAPEAVAAALPAAQPAAGVSSTVTPGAPSGTKAPQAKQAKTQRQKAPVAAGSVVEEDKPLLKLIEDADNTDVGNPLPASIRGAETVRAPGRASMTPEMLKKVRDALLRPSGKVGVGAGDKEQRIVNALGNFASSYKTYLDQGGQALSRRNKIPKAKTAAQFAEEQVAGVQVQAANVQAALAELGEAVGGNAKDIEAVVRLVKDMVQGKIVAPGKTRAEVIQAGKKLDTMLSQAWAAAKREAFMQAEPDTADIRGGAVRVSREQAGEVSPLEKAATEGVANPKGKGEKFTGLQGILQYIRNSGTPFERMLAATLRDVIGDQMSDVKLEFIAEGDPRFDPKTNTVYLRKNESPEVALHEALHAALQSFIYKNPKDPMVMQLKRSLKAVVGYKGELTGKAKEVQDLLKKLVAGKNELDAVLELVSYGTTLNEFRKALEAMPSKGVPQSFRESVNSVWRYIKAAMARMLGKPNTVAADVLDSSLALLEKASKVTPEKNTGNILRAEVTSLDAAAREAGWADAAAFAKGPGAFKTPTQVAFELIGLGRVNGKDLPVTTMIKETGAKTAEYIRKNVPTMERMILNFNSKFSNGSLVNDLIERFKFMQNTGYLQMERISQHLMSHPETAKPFLDFMDGNSKALDGVKNGAAFKAIAENLQTLMKQYIDSLPKNSPERRAFQNVKFSQYLLHPDNIGQVAGSTFGVKKLASMLGVERRAETSLDEFRTYLKEDSDGKVDLDDPLYQLFEDKGGEALPFGFISIEKFNNGLVPAGAKVATDRVWKMSQFKEGAFQFTSNKTAVKDAQLALKTDELSAALLNTTAALAHTFASRNFLTGLANVGRVDGKATSGTVAFNNVEELNAAFPDARISKEKLLEVSDESSKSPQIRFRSQRTGVWVKLPESETYGPLAGKIIPGPVWNSMLDMHDRAPLVNIQAFNDVMAFFKKAKTVYNPGTHVTNILSNITLSILHGITPSTMGRSAKMFYDFEANPDSMSKEDLALMKAFYASGAVLGQFSSTEVKKTVYDKLNQSITPDSDSSYITKLKSFSAYERAKARLVKYDNMASELYAAEDNVFRLAAFLNTAGNIQVRDGSKTLSAAQLEEAGLAGRKMFLDYDIDARAIRAMRQSFMPFISWSYAIMPVLGRIAIEKPWAMANVLMTYALMSAALGEGEDEEEKRKLAPEYLRDRAWGGLGPYMHLRLPFLGDDENPVYFNLGKYIPMFTLFQPPPGEAKLAGQEWVPGFATPSGPLVTLLSAMNGFDPFTGKPMHDPTDTQWDKLVNTGKAVYNTMAPAAVNVNFWKNVGDLSAGVTGPTGVEKSALFLARNLGGLGLYQFNVDESAFYQDVEVKKIKREFDTAMAKAKRLEYSKGYPDYEALDAELDKLQTRLQEQIAKARGEE